MGYLGEEIRLKRIFNKKSGKLLAITVDHSMARGIMNGLIPIRNTIKNIVAGRPDSITMHKGIAEKCFAPYANEVALVIKCSTFSPYQPTYDTWVTDVEEAVRLGADAVSMGCIVGGDRQPEQLRNLGLIAKQAKSFGMPLIAHIYPRGEMVPQNERYKWENIAYAVRAGAELGVDIIKTSYTGDPETFSHVVEACPVPVVIAGGDSAKTVEEFLNMTRDVIDAGAAGVTYGRFVWEYKEPSKLIQALGGIIHDGYTVEKALSMLE